MSGARARFVQSSSGGRWGGPPLSLDKSVLQYVPVWHKLCHDRPLKSLFCFVFFNFEVIQCLLLLHWFRRVVQEGSSQTIKEFSSFCDIFVRTFWRNGHISFDGLTQDPQIFAALWGQNKRWNLQIWNINTSRIGIWKEICYLYSHNLGKSTFYADLQRPTDPSCCQLYILKENTVNVFRGVNLFN